MKKEDREFVEGIRSLCGSEDRDILKLLNLVGRLDGELTELKKVVEPIRLVAAWTEVDLPDSNIVCTAKRKGVERYAYMTAGHLRALDKAFEGVEDG